MNATDRALTEQNQLFQGMDFTSAEYMLEHCYVRNIGITPTPYENLMSGHPHEKKLEDLIGEADQALYRAKELGRNREVIFG